MSQEPMSSDITSDDKLWAMLGYIMPFIGWIVAIVALLWKIRKTALTSNFNAVQSLGCRCYLIHYLNCNLWLW